MPNQHHRHLHSIHPKKTSAFSLHRNLRSHVKPICPYHLTALDPSILPPHTTIPNQLHTTTAPPAWYIFPPNTPPPRPTTTQLPGLSSQTIHHTCHTRTSLRIYRTHNLELFLRLTPPPAAAAMPEHHHHPLLTEDDTSGVSQSFRCKDPGPPSPNTLDKHFCLPVASLCTHTEMLQHERRQSASKTHAPIELLPVEIFGMCALLSHSKVCVLTRLSRHDNPMLVDRYADQWLYTEE